MAKPKFKSKFERDFAASLRKRGCKFDYESKKFPFVQPEMHRTYTPDFILKSGVIVECKGKLTLDEQKKFKWVRESHPDIPLIILFMRAKNKIRKGSKTSYGDWATKNGFEWYDWENGGIPTERLQQNENLTGN